MSELEEMEELTWIGYVFVEGEEIRSDEVKFLNIEEDVFGRDRMTFEYKGKRYTSLVIGRLGHD